MSITVSFRIPKKLKEKRDRFRGYVNWSEEVRRFLERRVHELEQTIAIEELERVIRELPETTRGTAARYVREDCDSH